MRCRRRMMRARSIQARGDVQRYVGPSQTRKVWPQNSNGPTTDSDGKRHHQLRQWALWQWAGQLCPQSLPGLIAAPGPALRVVHQGRR